MVALGFSKDTKLSIILETIGTERTKGLYAARGASLYALAKMSIDDNGNNANPQNREEGGAVVPGGLPVEGDAPKNVKSEEKSEDIISGDIVTIDNTKWVPGKNPYSVEIGDIVCDVYMSSENGKLNINAIDEKNREVFKNFLTKTGVDVNDADIITDSMLDWLDADDLTHINGAEDGYYGSLPDPYSSRDSPFSSIEEMVLIRGVTPEIFDNIRNYITVYGEKSISINVNNASKEVLSSIPGLNEDVVDDLALYIEGNGPVKEPEELRELFWDLGFIGSAFEEVKQYLTLEQSDFVTIRSNANNDYSGYNYKLIVGKEDEGFKIYAAYPE
jgi:general secretion pathway protein K